MLRLEPGIYENISETDYHADCAYEVSASASILKTLFNRSPEHARYDHPKLNPDFVADESSDFQIAGTVLHSMILETPPQYVALEFDAYRSKEAKEAKQAAIKDGMIPILRHKLPPLEAVAKALRARIAQMPDVAAAIKAAQKEVTLIWKERDVLCRSRFDILPPASFGFSYDLKFTSRSAEPEGWGRTLVNEYLFQSALYPRAVRALRGDKPLFVFLVCETDPPYGVSLHATDPQLEDMADRRLDRALSIWRDCIRSGKWPGYPTDVHYQAPPPWELARTEERMMRDSVSPGERYSRFADEAKGPPK